jgi:hypothetical protein
MKKMNNKGQGAMEYLMTYGWAILVVMIVGVVLWQLGVFNPGSGQATTVGFYKIKPLSPGDIEQTRATFSGVFINAVGTSISITDVQLAYQNPTGAACGTIQVYTPGMASTPLTMPDATGVTVGQGGTFIVNATTCASGGNPLSGSTYSAKLAVSYASEVGGFLRAGVENGTITGPIA